MVNYNYSPQNINLFSGIDYETPPPDPKWPPPMRQKAYYGLAGEFVNLVLPHTEADPAALRTQFLTMGGNVMGRIPYFQVEATRHYPRLNVDLVGDTAKSRKGTSYEHVETRFGGVDPVWAHGQIKSGLGSGEGLIPSCRHKGNTDFMIAPPVGAVREPHLQFG